MVESSEEIPLNPNSTPNKKLKQSAKHLNHGYDSAVDEAEKHLLDIKAASGIDCNRLRSSQRNENVHQNGRAASLIDSATSTQVGGGYPVTNLHDISAMSIASIYDREDDDVMDADNDIYNDVSFSKPSARASRELDGIYDTVEPIAQKSMAVTPNSINDRKIRREEERHRADCESCYSEPPDPVSNVTNAQAASLYFVDGERTIDFVLVWKDEKDGDAIIEDLKCTKRAIFEENLVYEGLELERETFQSLHFTKVHAPIEVLRRYSEILKLRLPMKESLCKVQEQNRLSRLSNAALYISHKIPGFRSVQTKTATTYGALKGCFHRLGNIISVDEKHFPERSMRFTAVYSRDKEYLFDVHNPCFFTAAIRSRIVKFILDRKRFTLGKDDDYAFGIDRLIDEGVYIAAYPLHDGEVNIPGSVRHLLYSEWASVRKWYRYQPLDYVKEYFGVKIGLYFAWLGYYTYMLLLASVVGVCCFLYALLTMESDIPSQDICDSRRLNLTMCPLCDRLCPYWPLHQACMHVKITYLFDNTATVFFAVFMSFWAVLFLELWKRYSAEITHRWDLTGFDIHEEHPRPQYLARLAHVKKIRIDYITNTKEPDPPFWRMKLPAAVFSFSIVLLLVALAFAAVLGVVLYRMSTLAALSISGNGWAISYAIYITTITAAFFNLALIFVFNWFYIWLAERLTEFEVLRTQTEFDDSLTLKIYLFQFVNYYASIFYIAFFKGKFNGYPSRYNRFLGFRQEECGLGGCLTELCIQLAIIMIGKQAMNTILEMVLPRLYKYYNTITVRLSRKGKQNGTEKDGQRWLRDLKLVEWGPQSLFSEYLEMVLQYGFVTIFVAAFPLAPLFALLNNILEMRFDAKKLLKFHRRPVTQRVRDIGVWYRILDCIGKLSVITNGFIIAFTSEFIPRLVYRILESPDGSLRNYVDHSLSVFRTSNFTIDEQPQAQLVEVRDCRYPDYREPPGSKHEYERTNFYWTVLAARLGFVLLFENVVAIVMILVRWAIPDMSAELRDKIRREAYITNEIIIKQEALRAQNLTNDPVAPSEVAEEDVDIKRMEQLMSENLSGSQLDLVMHGEGDPIAPGHSKPHIVETHELNKMFLETEKNGGRKSNNVNVIEHGQQHKDGPSTEVSSL